MREYNGLATRLVMEAHDRGLQYGRDNVDRLRTMSDDEYAGYNDFNQFTNHLTINHKVAYAIGSTHTNTIEGFWSLIKRAWYGQHHHYSIKWADHYITETTYKYNNRKNPNVFNNLLSHMLGMTP